MPHCVVASVVVSFGILHCATSVEDKDVIADIFQTTTLDSAVKFTLSLKTDVQSFFNIYKRTDPM
jgi:hypothetical protein